MVVVVDDEDDGVGFFWWLGLKAAAITALQASAVGLLGPVGTALAVTGTLERLAVVGLSHKTGGRLTSTSSSPSAGLLEPSA